MTRKFSKAGRLAGVLGLAAGLASLCLASLASAAPEPTALPKYEVTGFRDIRFGMTEPDVRAAATKTFALKPTDITSAVNPVEGTSVLTASVASLDPAPDPTAMIAAGTRLERYFAGFSWKKDTTRAGIPVGDNTVVLFSGEDEKKGAVRLIADGVKFQVQREGNQTTSPEPKGPPKLIINYIADRESPDIAKIEKGKF